MLVNKITGNRQAEEILRALTQAITAVKGEEFFRELVRNLAVAIGVRFAFVTECLDYPTTRVRMLAFWDNDDFNDNIEYDLTETPCEEVIDGGASCYMTDELVNRYPCQRELGVRSYLGIPIFDSSGRRIIGHMAFMHDQLLDDYQLAQSVCELFAVRAGAELQRKHAAEALHSTEARMCLMVDQMPALLWSTDIDLRVTSVDGSAMDGLEVTGDEIVGRTLYDFFRTDDHTLPPIAAALRALKGEAVTFEFEWKGKVFHSQVRAMRDARDAIIGTIGVGVDITAHKRTELALRESEAKYRLLVENQTDLVVKIDPAGRLLFVSPSYCEMFGTTEAELLGRPFMPQVHEQDQAATSAAWDSLFRPPYRAHVEQRALTRNGWRWLSWADKAVVDRSGNVREIVAVGRDITERKEAEETARERLKELAHLSRLTSMGEMASMLAHEINQPLCSILSYTQACLRLMKGDSSIAAELHQAMERVAANAERAGEIIRHMRSFVRKGEPQQAATDINRVVREIVALAETDARDHGVNVRLALNGGLPPVIVDAIQIQQVVLNLLRNGVEAVSAQSSGRREIEVQTRATAAGDVEVCVADSGPGIAPDLAGRIFEAFVTSKSEGMGMGLSICRSIVEAHGGRIWADAAPRGGAAFHFTLPTATESDAYAN